MPVLAVAADTSRDRIDVAWRAYVNKVGNPTRRSAIAQGLRATIPVGSIGFDSRKIFEAGYYNAIAMSDRLQSYLRMPALSPQDEQKARQLAGDIRACMPPPAAMVADAARSTTRRRTCWPSTGAMDPDRVEATAHFGPNRESSRRTAAPRP